MNKILEVLLEHSADIVYYDALSKESELTPTKACLDDVWQVIVDSEGSEAVYDAINGDDAFAIALSNAAMSKDIDDSAYTTGAALYFFRQRARYAIDDVVAEFWHVYNTHEAREMQ